MISNIYSFSPGFLCAWQSLRSVNPATGMLLILKINKYILKLWPLSSLRRQSQCSIMITTAVYNIRLKDGGFLVGKHGWCIYRWPILALTCYMNKKITIQISLPVNAELRRGRLSPPLRVPSPAEKGGGLALG